MRLVVAITGASGAVYGVRLLQVLRDKDVETHLIVTGSAETVIRQETETSVDEVKRLARYCYNENDFNAPIASGSYKSSGMVIIPCSMKTMGGLASGFAHNLVIRAADVTLKERRTLVLVPRETPLNAIHLENMLKLANIGAIILPPMPAFYGLPKSIDDIVNHTVGRVLDFLGVDHALYRRWGE